MSPTGSLKRTQRSVSNQRALRIVITFCLVAFLGNAISAHAQNSDKQIEAIRRLYQAVNEQIAAAEKEKPYSSIFCDELVRNVNENPWPAVGIFKSVTKAYYTFSRREGEPYPNQLLQITVTTQRSDRSEYVEYLFNSTGQLVFCLEKADGDQGIDVRYYFADGRAIRMIKGEKTLTISSSKELKDSQKVLREGLRLKNVFMLG